jgi:hypothetical protein
VVVNEGHHCGARGRRGWPDGCYLCRCLLVLVLVGCWQQPATFHLNKRCDLSELKWGLSGVLCMIICRGSNFRLMAKIILMIPINFPGALDTSQH